MPRAAQGQNDQQKSRMQRIRQLKEHEEMLAELRASSETTERVFNEMYDRAKEGK